MIDYSDILMSEYGWPRLYVLWGIPFSTGIKYINAITDRKTGKNSIEERLNDKKMLELAILLEELKQNGKSNLNRSNKT